MNNKNPSAAADLKVLFKRVEGVKDGGCYASIWLPEAGPTAQSPGIPAFLWYHGGGFKLGGSDLAPPKMVSQVLGRGAAFVSFDYRMLPHVDHRAIREDLLDSYLWIQDGVNNFLAASGKSVKIDGTRLCAAGGSAGGTCVLWLAADLIKFDAKKQTNDRLPPIRALLPIYPVTDMISFWASPKDRWEKALREIDWLADRWQALLAEPCVAGFEPNLEEMPPNSPPLGFHTTPRMAFSRITVELDVGNTLLCGDDDPKQVSPDHLLSADFPPTAVLVATVDSLIPPKQSYVIAEKLRALSVPCEVFECEGMDHAAAEFPIPGPGRQAWDAKIRDALDWVLDHCQ